MKLREFPSTFHWHTLADIGVYGEWFKGNLATCYVLSHERRQEGITLPTRVPTHSQDALSAHCAVPRTPVGVRQIRTVPTPEDLRLSAALTDTWNPRTTTHSVPNRRYTSDRSRQPNLPGRCGRAKIPPEAPHAVSRVHCGFYAPRSLHCDLRFHAAY